MDAELQPGIRDGGAPSISRQNSLRTEGSDESEGGRVFYLTALYLLM